MATINRRELLLESASVAGGLAVAALAGCGSLEADGEPGQFDSGPEGRRHGVILNDVQSRLNATRVHYTVRPESIDDLVAAVREAKRHGRPVSVAGGRHAMGTQQFGTDNAHVDVTALDRILELDRERGLVTVEAGIMWPELIRGLHVVFGDCQYATDLSGTAEEHLGVLPCYEPVDLSVPIADDQHELSEADWARLYTLMRGDKRQAFEDYADHYRKTDGQIYWSDTHQLAGAFLGHRQAVDAQKGTEMITEVYLSHENVMPFFGKIREDLARRQADITYGTIRFIAADTETFLPWAKQKSVCVVCNLHVQHTEQGITKAKADCRQIIARVIEFGGTFFLTYHRWATPEQVVASYPQIRNFLALKRKYDPWGVFQSDWYRHYAASL